MLKRRIQGLCGKLRCTLLVSDPLGTVKRLAFWGSRRVLAQGLRCDPIRLRATPPLMSNGPCADRASIALASGVRDDRRSTAARQPAIRRACGDRQSPTHVGRRTGREMMPKADTKQVEMQAASRPDRQCCSTESISAVARSGPRPRQMSCRHDRPSERFAVSTCPVSCRGAAEAREFNG
jgi:hypothetical protein